MTARAPTAAEVRQQHIHLGQQIRKRRRHRGFTQTQLGDRIGVRFQQVQKYECGDNSVSATRLFAIAEALETPIEYFYAGLQRDVPTDAANQLESEQKAAS